MKLFKPLTLAAGIAGMMFIATSSLAAAENASTTVNDVDVFNSKVTAELISARASPPEAAFVIVNTIGENAKISKTSIDITLENTGDLTLGTEQAAHTYDLMPGFGDNATANGIAATGNISPVHPPGMVSVVTIDSESWKVKTQPGAGGKTLTA